MPVEVKSNVGVNGILFGSSQDSETLENNISSLLQVDFKNGKVSAISFRSTSEFTINV